MTETIVITGCNRGIGLELTRQYERAGWRVYATCRQPETAYELNDVARGSSGRVSVHPLDVTNAAHIWALAQVVGSTPIDVLFNNAGVYGPDDQDLGGLDVDEWLHTFRINAIAPIKIIEALVGNVARGRRKLIASMTSKMGSMADNGSGGSYIYRSSKAALNAGMKSVAVDLRPRGITVLTLHPGWVKTEMGGPGALITAAECVTRLRGILDRATLNDSGKFFQSDGAEVPW